MRHHGDDGGGSRKGIVRETAGRKTAGLIATSRGKAGPFTGCLFLWQVSWCGSGNYGKCVPSMGSTQIQEATEGQGVRRQRKSRNRRERERDTGKSAEKGVSRREMTGKERMRVSDTGKMAKKGVSRTE